MPMEAIEPTKNILTLPELQSLLTPIFKKYQVKRAFLFGSYARGEATPESDVDIRVEKGDNDCLKSLIQSTGMWQDLTETIGKEVDLLTCLPSKKYDRPFYDNILRDEVLIYGT